MEPTPLTAETFTRTLYDLLRISQKVLKIYSLVLFKNLDPTLREVKGRSVTKLNSNDVQNNRSLIFGERNLHELLAREVMDCIIIIIIIIIIYFNCKWFFYPVAVVIQ
jgi:hypothetical protein